MRTNNSGALILTTVFVLCLWCGAAHAQIITTVAGTDFAFPATPLPAVSAPFGNIPGVTLDAQGNIYAADSGNNIVVRISPDGTLTTVAGNGIQGFSGDGGPATSASLDQPAGVAVDASGNVYIVDYDRIRKVSGGVITTVAGNGKGGFSGDGGPATSAELNAPAGIAVDSAGNIYIADTINNRIREVSGGTITTIAGNGSGGFAGDGGPATSAKLNDPAGVAIDSAGNLYIADWFNYRVRKVSGGNITTFAGNGLPLSLGDGGPATKASLAFPYGVAVDPSGNLYIADYISCNIRKVTGGIISTVAGNGQEGFSGDGSFATSAMLDFPKGVAADSSGNVYIADTLNDRVRRVFAGTISTIAGDGAYRFSGDGGSAAAASFAQPAGIAVDSSGNLYIADPVSSRIRLVSGGVVTTIAGNGVQEFSGDGVAATGTALNNPYGVAVDSAGNVYIADWLNSRVRKVSGGTITTVAGNGTSGFSGDGGPATSAKLYGPMAIAVDPAGDIYIADWGNHRIREVSGGTITTIAGNGTKGYSGDGGPATGAALQYPTGVAVDSAGNVYIADSQNYRVRMVSGGTITTVAGNGSEGYSGDGGPATSAELRLRGIAVDSAGTLYIADTFSNRVRKVTNGTITTIAGNGDEAFSGDGGLATAASLDEPWSLAIDSAGNIYIADMDNYRIREIPVAQPAVQVSTASLSFSAQATGAPAPTESFSIASVPGLAFSLSVSTTDGGNWLSVSPQNGAAPRLINVVADPSTLTSAGSYQGIITVATPNGNPPSSTVNVTFQVSAAQPPALAPLDPQSFSFAFAKSSPAQSQRLTVANAGGGTLSFTVAATIATPAGAQSLALSETSGQATPASPANIVITADPAILALGTGTFTGTVTVTAGSTTLSAPLTITVSGLDQAILLSQRGLLFTAVAQGGVIPPQTFAVLNIGSGSVPWTAKTIAIPATPAWFSVSPASGTTDAGQTPPTVSVSVDPSALLTAGTYYGLVEVDAPSAANTPQVLTVVLHLLPAGTDVGAALTPGSLLFTATAGASSPGSQNVSVYNVTANAKSFRSLVSADTGLSIVTLPTAATLDPQNPTPIVVQPFTTGLAAGIYNGVVTLEFNDGRIVRLTVKVIVTAAAAASAGSVRGNARAAIPADTAACTPAKLQPILTAPTDSFSGFTGFGIKVGVFVEDDCGVPMESGSVNVSFSNGDTAVALKPLQGGLWEGTWYTQNPSSNVNLTVNAASPQGVSGQLQTNGTLASDTPPAFERDSIIGAFGGVTPGLLAPGDVISIYGTNLAETALAAPPPPLPNTLVDTTVTVQGLSMPLYYVGGGQINAVVPYEVSGNSLNAPLQMLVERGNTLSLPVTVTVATAEPTIYGGGNAILASPADGSEPYFVSPSSPAHVGDYITLYCLGLGATNPSVPDGGLPPDGVYAWAAPIQMTIGGQSATVLYQGLTSQYTGLYQVNAVIPAGVPTGDNVPVAISMAGQTSPALPISIR